MPEILPACRCIGFWHCNNGYIPCVRSCTAFCARLLASDAEMVSICSQNTQLGQKWDAIGALKTQAEQNAEHIAKLEADVARLQQELDALPNDAAQPTQGTQAQPSNELRLLRQEHQELVNEVGIFLKDSPGTYNTLE